MEENKTELKLTYNVPISESLTSNQDFIIKGIAINSTTTANNHKFLAEELEQSAPTLRGVPLLVDHKNEVSAIKGRVINSFFDTQNKNIPFEAKVIDSEIKEMIKQGLINSVSIGASVSSVDEAEDGTLTPRGIKFRELSLVAVPADENATFGFMFNQAYNMFKEKSQSSYDEKLKGGLKIMDEKTETKVVDNSSQMSEMAENLKKLSEELANLKAEKVKEAEEKAKLIAEEKAKVDAKALAELKEAKEEVKEDCKYNIKSGYGEMKGLSFTLVR